MPWLLIPFAYLLGSLSAAYWAGRFNRIDLRQHGSGNLGATNAGRVLGARWFAVVFIADVLKGVLPVIAAHLFACSPGSRAWLLLATATAVVLGHVFTCFHGFKGGKAVATSLGILAALVWPVALAALGSWLIAWFIGVRFGRLGKAGAVGPASVVASLSVPPARLLLYAQPWSTAEWPITIFLLLLALLVVVKHRSNLKAIFSATTRAPSPTSQASP